MSVTRKNHFVPQWHQERFFADGKNTLFYLNLAPPMHNRRDGSPKPGNSLFRSPTSRAFVQQDLYSTFFGTDVDDQIERKLFGDIDGRGAEAVRAFTGTDQAAWHSNFENFFEYLDIQKLRTPKGLAWLRKQYPELSQNELMQEMQSIQMLNITTWMTGVREIVSAEKSPTKFIVTDHPVTIYNHGVAPTDSRNQYPDDPSIALKGSQTVYPLGADHCLILTNLEYAQEPGVDPLVKRTFARRFHPAMVSTINFIRTRHLTQQQVVEVNFIMKARAEKHIAAGREEWLYPEKTVTKSWCDLRATLLPPQNGLFHFGGEMYVGYEDGRVDYQDQFGRSEKPRPWLIKPARAQPLKPRDICGCGSGFSFGDCCKSKPAHLRVIWSEKSIRERNLMLLTGVANLFEMAGKDWNTVRKEMTDERISKVYSMYESLWPRETDLLSLLPKPDGTLRSVYTGSLHPKLITEFALGSSLYFGEIIIQHPFINPNSLAKKMRPTEDPHAFRGEILKSLMTFLNIMPLVEIGLVHLIPDPCDFDLHLRDQMMHMASARRKMPRFDPKDDPRMEKVIQEDMHRTMLGIPEKALRSLLAKMPQPDTTLDVDEMMPFIEQIRLDDPLAVLQENSLGSGGQLEIMKMAPNFEMAMYLAQATGAQILTDSPFRWRELQAALNRRYIGTEPALQNLQVAIQAAPFRFPVDHQAIEALGASGASAEITSVFRSAFNYIRDRKVGGTKPNFEKHLAARFLRGKRAADAAMDRAEIQYSTGKVTSLFRVKGFQDNTVNRLLLMSSSEHHLPWVPMATYISR